MLKPREKEILKAILEGKKIRRKTDKGVIIHNIKMDARKALVYVVDGYADYLEIEDEEDA